MDSEKREELLVLKRITALSNLIKNQQSKHADRPGILKKPKQPFSNYSMQWVSHPSQKFYQPQKVSSQMYVPKTKMHWMASGKQQCVKAKMAKQNPVTTKDHMTWRAPVKPSTSSPKKQLSNGCNKREICNKPAKHSGMKFTWSKTPLKLNIDKSKRLSKYSLNNIQQGYTSQRNFHSLRNRFSHKYINVQYKQKRAGYFNYCDTSNRIYSRNSYHRSLYFPKKISKEQTVIRVDGMPYYLNRSKMTLRKIATDQSPSCKSLDRIYLGGVKFIQTEPGILKPSSTHFAQSRANQAIQRSILIKRRNKQKINKMCLIYHRLGRCISHQKKMCPYVHDPRTIAICKLFLQGKCANSMCKLSHKPEPEKMPICKYFLEGRCNNSDCPYTHVKVNANASVCADFVRGYCPAGAQCMKRHIVLCPEFKNRRCTKENKSQLPSILRKKVTKASRKTATVVSQKYKRYFEDKKDVSDSEECHEYSPEMSAKRNRLLYNIQLMKQHGLPAEDTTSVSSSENHNRDTKVFRTVGSLPDYIPLV